MLLYLYMFSHNVYKYKYFDSQKAFSFVLAKINVVIGVCARGEAIYIYWCQKRLSENRIGRAVARLFVYALVIKYTREINCHNSLPVSLRCVRVCLCLVFAASNAVFDDVFYARFVVLFPYALRQFYCYFWRCFIRLPCHVYSNRDLFGFYRMVIFPTNIIIIICPMSQLEVGKRSRKTLTPNFEFGFKHAVEQDAWLRCYLQRKFIFYGN